MYIYNAVQDKERFVAEGAIHSMMTKWCRSEVFLFYFYFFTIFSTCVSYRVLRGKVDLNNSVAVVRDWERLVREEQSFRGRLVVPLSRGAFTHHAPNRKVVKIPLVPTWTRQRFSQRNLLAWPHRRRGLASDGVRYAGARSSVCGRFRSVTKLRLEWYGGVFLG